MISTITITTRKRKAAMKKEIPPMPHPARLLTIVLASSSHISEICSLPPIVYLKYFLGSGRLKLVRVRE